MAAWPRRQAFWPQARNEEEAMLAEASVTTNDAACGQKDAAPSGCDDAGAFSLLRLLDDALRCIACVAAP